MCWKDADEEIVSDDEQLWIWDDGSVVESFVASFGPLALRL